jgi:hypothetical protein
MKPHVKIYMQYFDLGIEDIVQCEACMKPGRINNGFDIHHINGRVGKDANNIRNLALLCRDCHDKAHSTISKGEMQLIHAYFLQGTRKVFIK